MKTLAAFLILILTTAPTVLSQNAKPAAKNPDAIRVLIWSEGTAPKDPYPTDIRGAIADMFAARADVVARTGTLSDPEQGLREEGLKNTDVLIWWGHMKQGDVKDEYVERIMKQVNERGMGLIVLHSAHHSKIFKRVIASSGDLGGWREDGKLSHVWVAEPNHPIAAGLPQNGFVLPREEMYCEPFVVKTPDTVVFMSTYSGGDEVFRSGCCWEIGPKKARVFYFQPGHETYPVYLDKNVQLIISNAVAWCAKKK